MFYNICSYNNRTIDYLEIQYNNLNFQILQNREHSAITAEPIRKHVFTAGFGLAHAITMLIISATHQILVRHSNVSNSVQVNLKKVLQSIMVFLVKIYG